MPALARTPPPFPFLLSPCSFFLFSASERAMSPMTFFSRCLVASACLATALGFTSAFAADPYASNNGFYPLAQWTGPYRTLNFDYPDKAVEKTSGLVRQKGALTVESAPAYVDSLKKRVEPAMRGMIEKPSEWNPKAVGWYDMPWQAEGTATGGREAILASFAGQVLPPGAFTGLDQPLQNHTVVYYDARSATMLKKLWANPFNPNRQSVVFPEGAMVVKAAAVTATPEQWPVLKDAAVWNVFRPTVADTLAAMKNPAQPAVPTLLPLRLLQFDIIVKDSVASPQTGWVFTTFVYKADAPGAGAWDRLVPLGAQWGNDPQLALSPTGTARNGKPDALRETWINPQAPAFSKEMLGWGGRLSGPIDVAKRHNVIFTDGAVRKEQRSSSCMGCHGTAQYPFIANLYPSPNRSFPPDGSPFLLYPPGSPEWARWFQNRPGNQAQNQGAGTVALDYDMLIMLALSAFDAAAGGDRYLQQRIRAH
jgi:hypothetical protein